MQTITINLINPKVKKLINELVDLKLISIETKSKYPQDLLDALDKEYENYQNGIGKTFSKDEVFSAIRKKKVI